MTLFGIRRFVLRLALVSAIALPYLGLAWGFSEKFGAKTLSSALETLTMIAMTIAFAVWIRVLLWKLSGRTVNVRETLGLERKTGAPHGSE